MPSKAAWFPSACFFAIAVAFTLGWTAVSSELTFFTIQYGSEVLLLLNVAYFVCGLPVMLASSLWDERFDEIFGTACATAFRLVVGLGGAALVCATFPFHAQKLGVLLLAVGLLGLFSGIAFGSTYQLVARFGAKESVALTTGFVGSGPVIILLEAVLRIGAQPKHWQRVVLYEVTALLIVGGMAAGLQLLSRSWRQLDGHECAAEDSPRAAEDRQLLQQHDAPNRQQHPRRQTVRQGSIGWNQHSEQPILEAVLVQDEGLPTAADAESSAFNGINAPSEQRSDLRRMLKIWPAAIALFLSAFTSVLLFPFFTYVEMTAANIFHVMLPQALFAARVMADIGGRLVPKAKFLQTGTGVLVWSLIRLAVTPLFIFYIKGSLPWVSQSMVILYVAVFWFSSGYINTCAFILAPQLVPNALASRAGGIMALVFQLASSFALLIAYLIQLALRHAAA